MTDFTPREKWLMEQIFNETKDNAYCSNPLDGEIIHAYYLFESLLKAQLVLHPNDENYGKTFKERLLENAPE